MIRESNLLAETSTMIDERKGNCAQIIFSTFGPNLGMQKIDKDVCMSIAAAFGGGINQTGNVCGAVTGALMVIGLKYGKNIKEATRFAYEFIAEFTRIHGSIICSELIGPVFTDENPQKASQEDTFKKCKKCIEDAAKFLEKYVKLEENRQ